MSSGGIVDNGASGTSTEVDRLLRLVHDGLADVGDLVPALLEATLLVYGGSGAGLTGFPGVDGRVMVPACTSAATVPAGWPGARPLTGREIAGLLRDHPLVVNPDGPVTVVVPAGRLLWSAGR